MASTMRIVLVFLTIMVFHNQSAIAWNPFRSNRNQLPAQQLPSFVNPRTFAAATVGCMVQLTAFDSIPLLLVDGTPFGSQHQSSVKLIEAAHADSTGKMSTKLTARKRYLPRVVKGVGYLNSLIANPADKAAVDLFVTDELPSLKRAMNLYGASLRKGEVPDEISREAEQLTESFYSEAAKLSAVANKGGDVAQQLQLVKSRMDAYVSFAKIELQ